MPHSRSEFDSLLECSLDKIEGGFSAEDRRLRAWLAQLGEDDFAALVAVLEERWFNDAKTDRWMKHVLAAQGRVLSPLDRDVGATLIVHELREYSGHTLNFFTDKPHYEEILPRIHKRVAKEFKRGVPPAVASVSFRERAITEILTGAALASLTSEELAEALGGLDVPDEVKRNATLHIGEALAGGGIAGVVKVVGKKVIKDVVLKVVEGMLVKKIGKKAAAELVKKIASKVPQKIFARVLGFIGLALLAWDIVSIGSEATRVTTPLIISISMYRTVESLSRSSDA